MATATEKRSCKGTAKKTGEPCETPPVTGQDYCMGHLPRSVKDELGFGGPQPNSGPPRKPRMIDLMREWLEEHPEVMGIVQDALKAERAVVVGNGPSAHVEMVPDWPTRLVAYREFCDRSYGRPTQATEIRLVQESEFDAAIRELEERIGANDPAGPGDTAGEDRALQGAAG